MIHVFSFSLQADFFFFFFALKKAGGFLFLCVLEVYQHFLAGPIVSKNHSDLQAKQFQRNSENEPFPGKLLTPLCVLLKVLNCQPFPNKTNFSSASRFIWQVFSVYFSFIRRRYHLVGYHTVRLLIRATFNCTLVQHLLFPLFVCR